MKPDELQARAPLWEALSNLWLDTELQDHDFKYIARVISASPYTLAQANTIHNQEVAPVLWTNLGIGVIGAWDGFDRAWLLEKCGEQFREKSVPWPTM